MKLFFLLLTALLTGQCTTNPHSKRMQLNLIPKNQIKAMGVKAYAEIKKKEVLIKSGPVFNQVLRIGRDIAKASGIPYKWEFIVIKNDSMVNAFCLPGGKIAVYTGILPVAKNEAGLAAIMGHEVAHAVLKHGAERMSQTMILQMGLKAADLSLKNQKHKATVLAALGLGTQFGVMMPFSRHHESEADKIGLKFMATAGYDPKEAPKLWGRMAQKGSGVPEFLSTHPDPKRRARELQNEIKKVSATYANSLKKTNNMLAK